MRNIILIFLLAFSGVLYGQIRTTGITYTSGIPTHTPSASQGSLIAIDTSTKIIYGYYGTWKDLGATLQFTGSASAPTGVPTDFTSRFALNTVDSLYAYQSGTWKHLNKATDLTPYVEWSDTLTFISTRQDLIDTAAAIRGDFPVVSDTATFLMQDSILVYYANGIEFDRDTISGIGGGTNTDSTTVLVQDSILVYYDLGVEYDRDTIRFPAIDLTGYVEWSDTTTFIATRQDLIDTAVAIRGDFPDVSNFVEYDDSLSIFVTPDMLNDTSIAIRGDFPVMLDTATFILQDSIAVYYANGLEFGRDTIRVPATDLSDYVQYSDSLTVFVTPDMLNDTSIAIRGDFPVLVPDTVTLLTQDSILIYYEDGGEVGRDTIRIPGSDNWGLQVVEVLFGLLGDGTTGNELEVDSSSVATLFALQDSCLDIRAAFPVTNITVGGSGPTYVIESSTGADITISVSGIATLSEPSANELRITVNEVDGSINNEGSLTVAAGTGSTSIINSNTSGSTGVTITAAGINTISEAGQVITITATEAQALTLNGTGPYVFDISAGADITVSEGYGVNLSEPVSNELRTTIDTAEIASIYALADTASDLRALLVTDTVETIRGYIEGQTGTTFDLDAYDNKTKDVDGDTMYFDIPTNLDNFKVYKNGVELNRTGTSTTRDYAANASTNVLTLSDALVIADRLIVHNITGSGYVINQAVVNPPEAENIENADFTAIMGIINLVDCSGGVITVDVPAGTPQINSRFAISDATANAGTNNITIDFITAGDDLYGASQNYVLNVDGGYVEFIWMGATTGWIATK